MIGLRAQGDINDTKFVEYFKIVQSFAEKEKEEKGENDQTIPSP